MLLLSVFTLVYEALIGANPQNPEYRDGVFSSVGFMSICISLIICSLFYAALGRWKPVFHKTTHWIITLSLNTVIGFLLAYLLTDKEIGMIDGYAMRFAFVSACYAAVYFIALSAVFRRLSIFARHTPL